MKLSKLSDRECWRVLAMCLNILTILIQKCLSIHSMHQQNTNALRELNNMSHSKKLIHVCKYYKTFIKKKSLHTILHFKKKLHVHLHAIKYWSRIMILVGFSWRKWLPVVTVLEVCHEDVYFKLEFPRGNHQELSQKMCVLVGDLWYTVYMADIVDMVRFWQTGDFNC